MMSTNSPGFKIGGMIKLCNTSSEESEPQHPRIVLSDNSELNELLTEINESAYKMPESP